MVAPLLAARWHYVTCLYNPVTEDVTIIILSFRNTGKGCLNLVVRENNKRWRCCYYRGRGKVKKVFTSNVLTNIIFSHYYLFVNVNC